VEKDAAPPSVWSLDGTVDGPLVVGRTLFFEAVAKAGEPGSRVRGVWIKRTSPAGSSVGLGYSYDILGQLLTRRGPNHRLVRVPQDETVPDLVADIRERARSAGLAVPDPQSEPGVAQGQAPPEATAKDRAAVLVAAIDAIAADEGLVVWFFFDNPTVTVSDSARLAMEGFVAAALVRPHVRLVIAGFETYLLSGEQFDTATPAEGNRLPGLVVEVIGGGFRREDILDVLRLAAEDLAPSRPGGNDRDFAYAARRALFGIRPVNGIYADEALEKVTEGLRPDLELLRDPGGG
jgi:hypothetical protein